MGLQLSIIIPAYNEVRRIGLTLEQVAAYVAGNKISCEIIVVDDGSCDQTAAAVLQLAQKLPVLRLVSLNKNMGKGAAVRKGMQLAEGELVMFYDADASTPIRELSQVLGKNFDVLIASRRIAGAQLTLRQPFFRELAGKFLGFIIRIIFPELHGILDTQCGFKVFRREVAQAIFSKAQINGFLFDVEVLVLARHLGYNIVQLPVTWRNDTQSKVGMLRHLRQVLSELVKIRIFTR